MPGIPALCSRGCPDACQMLVEMEGGRAVKLTGEETNPYTRGTLCASQEHYLERVYHPRRVLHPHVKAAESYGTWVRTDIPFVLKDLTQRITRTLADHGPLSILHIQGLQRTGWSGALNKLFFRLLGGTSTLYDEDGDSPGALAFKQDFGALDSPDPRELLNSRLILLWGHNPFVRNEHLVPFLSYAHKKGAKIVCIDPVYSPAVKIADAYYQIKPGTEGHLALALAHFIVKNNWFDAAFLKAYADNPGEFFSIAGGAKGELLAAQCDVSISTVENLARLMATTKPVSMVLGEPLEGQTHAPQTVRLINALSVLVGQVGIAGGGLVFRNPAKGLDLGFVEKTPVRQTRALALKEILDGRWPKDPPIQMAFVNRANPVFGLPEGDKFWRFLKQVPTVVLSDMFFTDTSDAATHFLPATSILEEDELVTSTWHKGIGVSREVLAPRGQARSEFFWYRRLARRLDLKDLDKPLSWFFSLMTARLRAQGLTLEKMAGRMVLNPQETKIAYPDHVFPTPSKKIEFITHTAFPAVTEDPEYPLLLIPLLHRELLEDQALDDDTDGMPMAVAHPDTLARFELGPEMEATVVSPHGQIRVRLAGDPFQRKDLLLIPRGRSLFSDQNVLSLLSYRPTTSGTGRVLYETRVKLLK